MNDQKPVLPARPIAKPEELFDVVDEQDHVVQTLPRSEVHRRKLFHRAVSVFVWNSAGQLLLQQRTATKDEYPLCFTSSASGHVSAGDDYDETAVREMQEEVGLTAPLQRLFKFPASVEMAYEHTVLYETHTDETPTPDAAEVLELSWWTLDDLAARINANPAEFTPPLQQMFAWYRHSRSQSH